MSQGFDVSKREDSQGFETPGEEGRSDVMESRPDVVETV